MHCRLSPHTFEGLVHKMIDVAELFNINMSKAGYPKTCLEKEIMVTIMVFG